VAAHQQVGDFTATNVNGKIVKQGGNVASYFCTPAGRVIHAVIGPVSADELLKEANWTLAAWDKAKSLDGLPRQERQIALAHQGEIPTVPLQGKSTPAGYYRAVANAWAHVAQLVGTQPQKVHQLLAQQPLAPLEEVYVQVFEQILGERVSKSAPNVALAEQGLQFAERANRPLLFILHDARENSHFKEQWLTWLKSKEHRNPILLALMRQCVVVVLPQKEMPALSSRLKQEPYSVPALGTPLFIITDARGKQLDSFAGYQSENQLNLPLAKAIVAEIKLAPPQSVPKLKDIAALIRRIDPSLAAELQVVIDEVIDNQKRARLANNEP
jgi:hypothetical protein